MPTDLVIDCRQCGSATSTQLLRRRRDGVRYRCLRCDAVVRTTDLTTLRPRGPARPPDVLTRIMPADMAAWARATASRRLTADTLTRSVVYDQYQRWDRAHPAGLPPFPAVVALLHARRHRPEPVVAELSERHAGDPALVAARVGHALAWLTLRAPVTAPDAASPPGSAS